jgi:hypothetical protein
MRATTNNEAWASRAAEDAGPDTPRQPPDPIEPDPSPPDPRDPPPYPRYEDVPPTRPIDTGSAASPSSQRGARPRNGVGA